MKKCLLIIPLLLQVFWAPAQSVYNVDSLKTALSHSTEDTNRVNQYGNIGWLYMYSYPDTAVSYAFKGLELARKLNFKQGEILNLLVMGEALAIKGNYTKALEVKLEALKEAEKLNDPYWIAGVYNFIGTNYYYSGDYRRALFYFNKIRKNKDAINKYTLGEIGECYLGLNSLDSAYHYLKQAYELDAKDQNHWSVPYHKLAAIYDKKGNYAQALDFYRAGNRLLKREEIDIIISYAGMAAVFNKMDKQDSAVYYARRAVEEGLKRPYYPEVINAGNILTDIYKSNGAFDSAFKYQEITLAARDSLFSKEKVQNLQNLAFNEQLQQQEAVAQQARYRNRLRMNAVMGTSFTLLVIALLMWRNIRHRKKAYIALEKQKAKTEGALQELKFTQSQLIQREKMASLGELTAGIAHEIQNPLNFVNNFSEVNTELLEEMKLELQADHKEQALAAAEDAIENNQKINLHGKRADSIVKSMMEHSRSSTGVKELTDLNSLVEKYLLLAFHGMRAKDISFNAHLETEYDSLVGKVNIVAQDLGRAMLNLFNNAFYSVHQKMMQRNGTYEPVVSVSTTRANGKIEISVRDNGMGIPKKMINKIYQPFFTTKPTGQGTGLGLSLSYDIITKEHGGELKVDTKEGEYAEFIIQLPVENTSC